MSQSRLEKVGTVHSRMQALLKSGARRKEFRPIWMDIYEAFPPRLEPRWDREADESPLNRILYREDRARAQFFRQFGDRHQVYDLLQPQDPASKTLAQRFVERFAKLEESPSSEGKSFEALFSEAVEAMEAEEGVDLRSLDAEGVAGKSKAFVRREEGEREAPPDPSPYEDRPKIQRVSFKELFAKGQQEQQQQQGDEGEPKS